MFNQSAVRHFRAPLRGFYKLKRDLVHRTLGVPWLRSRPTDCFIASWPRSGNTWMRNLVFRALNPQVEVTHELLDHKIPEVDHLAFKSHLRALSGSEPRIVKTHEPYRAEFGVGKTVYIVRDGRDATLSWHHFRRSFEMTEASFDQFLHRCVKGKIRYGAWHTNVESWLRAGQQNERILVVRYEDLLSNAEQILTDVLQHFGLSVDGGDVKRAIAESSVERVNGQFQSWAQEKGKDFSGGLGGGAGRSKVSFTEIQRKYFNQVSAPALRLAGYSLDE